MLKEKKIARPHLTKDSEGEWWLEYEGHTTNEIAFSPNEKWVCGVFRLQERNLFVLAKFGTVELKFLVPIPLTFNVSDKGVGATVEYAEGGERRLSFFFPDGAVGKTDPIPELQQTDRITFNKRFSEVNLLAIDGRIIKSYHFGELDAHVFTNTVVYKRNDILIGFYVGLGVIAAFLLWLVIVVWKGF